MKRAALLVLLLTFFPASAVTHTWTGAVSSSWANPANWTGGSPAGDPSSELVFPAVTNRTALDDIPGAIYVSSIAFEASDYMLGVVPGSSIALSGQIYSVSSLRSNIQIAIPIQLTGGTSHWFRNVELTLTGVISGASASDGISFFDAATLTADNTYSGATAVMGGSIDRGILTVEGLQASSAVSVAFGGRLVGRGTVGPLAAGGEVSPGTDLGQAGTLTVAGSAVFSSGATFETWLQAAAPSDELVVQGAATLGGAQLRLPADDTLGVGQVFTILEASGGVSGIFAGLPDDTVFTYGCHSFRIDYTATTVVITRQGPAPLTGVSISVNGATTLCTSSAGGTAIVDDTGGSCDRTHQWGYRATSGGVITPIAGATATSYVINGIDFGGAGSYYLVETTTTSGGGSITSNEIPVTVLQAPTAAASGSATVCPGGSTPLTGSGGTACVWSPATGLSDPFSCTPTATPPATTTYTLTVTANSCSSSNAPTVTVTVDPGCATRYYSLPPCRALDTRNPTGPYGGPPLGYLAAMSRTFVLTGVCGVPANAVGVSANLTVVEPSAPGWIRAYPSNTSPPETSGVNFTTGQTRANNATLQLATDGTGGVSFELGPNGTAHLIVDVNGFYR